MRQTAIPEAFMTRLRVLSPLLVLLLGCCAAPAQPRTAPAESSITITGIVQSQGKPLSGALVTLWEQSSGGDPTDRSTVAKGQTDSSGNYELKNVPTGNYFIAASAPGFVSGKENDFLAKLRYVTVVGGKALNPFNFDLVREGVITGTVTDADGKPLSGIPITLTADAIPVGSGPPRYAENLRTDEQGRYRISGMPAGKYRLAAGHWPLLNGTLSGRLAYRRVFIRKLLMRRRRGFLTSPSAQKSPALISASDSPLKLSQCGGELLTIERANQLRLWATIWPPT